MELSSPSDTFRLSSPPSSIALTPSSEQPDPLSVLRLTCRKYEEENSHLRQEVECGTDCIKRLHSARSLLSEELQETQRMLEDMQRERESVGGVLNCALKSLGGEQMAGKASLLALAQEITRLAASRSKLKLKKRSKCDPRASETNENDPPNKHENWKQTAKARRRVGSAEFEMQASRGRLALTHKSTELRAVFESIRSKGDKPGSSRKQSVQTKPGLEKHDTHCRTLSSTDSVRCGVRLSRV